MSGSFRIESRRQALPGRFHHPRSKDATHDHVVFTLPDRPATTRIIYNDPRRFGFMDRCAARSMPSTTSCSRLSASSRRAMRSRRRLPGRTPSAGRQTSLKAALLDQRIIAGLGNIYVCEALWRARLSPRRKAGDRWSTGAADLSRGWRRLTLSIRTVIADAIAAGGSIAARLSPGRRIARLFPAQFRRLRPRRATLPPRGMRAGRSGESSRQAGRHSIVPPARPDAEASTP